MIGIVGLEDDTAAAGFSSCTSCDLSEHLKGPLGRSKIRKMQRQISTKDADQCDSREIVTFDDHLITNKYISFLFSEPLEDRFQLMRLLNRIAIETLYASSGNNADTSSTTFSVPTPPNRSFSLEQHGHSGGATCENPQRWHLSALSFL